MKNPAHIRKPTEPELLRAVKCFALAAMHGHAQEIAIMHGVNPTVQLEVVVDKRTNRLIVRPCK